VTLKVKNQEAVDLAHELARVTGETITTAVTVALRERLERARKVATVPLSERLLDIGRDTAPRLTESSRSEDSGELLHDDLGLPR